MNARQKGFPLQCYLDGRFLGPDGHPDLIDGEVGYPRCGRCVREHRGVHLINDECQTVHPETFEPLREGAW